MDAAGAGHGTAMKAFLAIRAEQRLLKPTGSTYLHCDPLASRYLRLVIDCAFSKDDFRDK